MKREIKFRAKAKGRNIWVFGRYFMAPLTIENFGAGFLSVPENNLIHCIEQNNVAWEIDIETLGQFTGLLDKNRTKIYEDDILTMLNIDYLVEWNDKKGRWNFYNPELSHPSYWGLTAEQMKRCKVIGNIYSNPKLLGKELGDE